MLCAAVTGSCAEYEQLDHVMHRDPEISFPEPIRVFSERLVPLWLEALASPEVDLQRQAAESFARVHIRGLKNMDNVVQPLAKKVSSPDSHPIVRLAAARALVTLNARGTAQTLFDYSSQGGSDAAQIIEPALARWDFEPIRAVWLARFGEARPSTRVLSLAIHGLAEAGDEQAIPKLLALVKSTSHSAGLRLEASWSLGRLQPTGLESLATELMSDISPRGIPNRLIAASLMSHHSVDSALALLEKLALDNEPAVAAIALRRLLEVDPSRIVAIADRLLANRDANVRYLAAQALVKRPAIATIQQLAPLLNDPHPRNRQFVSQSLIELAKQLEFDATVRSVAMETLATDHWRGIEQAALILVALDHKPAADRLVTLLEFKRPEVSVTAAWALRNLAVPSTLEPMLDRAMRLSKDVGVDGLKNDLGATDRQVAHLFEAFWQMEFREAEPLMRQYIPKGSQPLQSRAAAIWALGHFHAGKPDPELTKLFAERLADIESPLDPEASEIGCMAAVSLGRMNAKTAVAQLRHFLDAYTVDTDLGYVSGWAIQQITGEQPPKQKPRVIPEIGWFLQPLED